MTVILAWYWPLAEGAATTAGHSYACTYVYTKERKRGGGVSVRERKSRGAGKELSSSHPVLEARRMGFGLRS